MSDALGTRCPICKTSEKLFQCERCIVVSYCSRDHQLANMDDHKEKCHLAMMSRLAVDFLAQENFVEGSDDLSEYSTAQFSLVDRLLQIKTYDAVKTAFDHTMDLLRLDPYDSPSTKIKFIAPSLFLRLGYDQQCYNFLKLHATDNVESWRDMKKSILELRDENVFEAVNEFTKEDADMTHAAALMLIKIRLLKDVQWLQNSYFLYDDEYIFPPEIIDRIRKASVGKIISKRIDILINKDQSSLIETLEEQIHQLFEFVKQNNEYVWPGLLHKNIADYLEELPNLINLPDYEELEYLSQYYMLIQMCTLPRLPQMIAATTIQYVYDAYAETTGSIEMIREIIKKELDGNL